MKSNVTIIVLLLVLSLMSCEISNIDPPDINPEGLLKTKSINKRIEETSPQRIEEYLYNGDRNVERINHYFEDITGTHYEYDVFEYSIDKLLLDKYTYQYANDELGWLLNSSTHYSYEDQLLILEETTQAPSNLYTISFQYEYDNSILIKKTYYINQNLQYCIVFEYADGVCIKETQFKDLDLETIKTYTIHHYDQGQLTRSELYSYINGLIQVITYTYDDDGKLIIEEAKGTEVLVTKPMYYVYRYEYY